MSEGNDFIGKLEEYAGNNQRLEDRGPPTGHRERRGGRHENGVASTRRGLKWIAGILGSMAVIVTSGVTLAPYAPFPTKAQAAEAQRKVDVKLDDHDKRIGFVEQRLSSIDTNGLRTLNLQLRATLRSIESDLKALPASSPGRANLEAQRDQAQLDLDENNAILRARGK